MTLLQIHEPGETPEPHDAPAIGIDLGTTHSVAAVQIGRELRMLPLQAGKALLPSIVTYQAEGSPVVGAAASGARIASIKRLMGRSLAEARELHPEQAFAPAEPVRLLLAGRQITPVEIAADILRAVAKAASDALGQTVARAVVTVPAYFDDGARQATKDAARLAGLEVLRLISEPTAAALAYGLAERAQGCYAVYDLGGGTFDISILTLEDGVFQVRATSGDLALGGDDIDRAIARRWAGEQGPITDALLAFARAAKEALSETPNVTVAERFTLDRDMLATLAAPYIERTLSLCASALADAALTLSQINGVVLVGGSTRMPLVRDAVTRYFGQTPYTGLNPDEVVARGAALQARALTEGADTLLLDVVPLSLGLETMGGLVEKLIHRNTPIPVQVTQEFTTYQDGQDGMMIHAVQGEREMVAQNRSLARFTLTGIPPLPAGIARIRVAFAVDADGLLTVSAREATTGAEQAIHVTPSYGLGEGDIERMLLESMRHAKDDILLRLLSEARVDAERALAEVTSALAQDQALLSKSEHDAIQRAMRLLQETMQGDQRETIDETREALYHATRIFAERRMDKAIHGALAGLHIDAAISPSPSPPAAVLHYDPVKRG